MTPLITICIPTYKRPHHIKNSLENLSNIYNSCPSALDYTAVLVSDNCSNDATSAICSQYEKYKWFSWYSQNKNIGLDGQHYFFSKTVTTDYIWVVGDDDIISIDTLEEAIKIAKSYNPAAIFFNVSQASAGNLWDFSFYPKGKKRLYLKGGLEQALSTVKDNVQFISTQIFRLEYVREAYAVAFFSQLKDINIYAALCAMNGLCIVEPNYFIYVNRSSPASERVSDNLGPSWVNTFWSRPREAIMLYEKKVAEIDHTRLNPFYRRQDFQFLRTLFVEVADRKQPYIPSYNEVLMYVHAIPVKVVCLILITCPRGLLKRLMKSFRFIKFLTRK